MGKAELIWVDVETTGLDPQRDEILEIGVRVTDKYYRTLGERSSLVYSPKSIWKLRNGDMSPITCEIHEKSGLAADLLQMDAVNSSDRLLTMHGAGVVAADLYYWLTDDMGLEHGKFPMAGSSVHFDKRFIDQWMPKLGGFFNHRIIDTSVLRNLAEIYNPRIFEHRPAFPAPHRPLRCLDGSIQDMKYFEQEFLLVDGSIPLDGDL